ncbi:MAG: hypothetical protein H7837_11370 [Magnetococcus sp. MYC-9]
MSTVVQVGFTLDTSQLLWVAGSLREAPEPVIQEIKRAVLEAELLLVRESAERTPTATGLLRASIVPAIPEVRDGVVVGAVVTDSAHRQGGGIALGAGTPLAYAVPVELGSKPHMPPLQPLIDWVVQKLGIRGARESEEVARKIRWKIYHRGTQGSHMFGRALAASMPRIKTIFERHLRAAVGRVTQGESHD